MGKCILSKLISLIGFTKVHFPILFDFHRFMCPLGRHTPVEAISINFVSFLPFLNFFQDVFLLKNSMQANPYYYLQ